MAKDIEKKRVITGKFVANFVAVFKPIAFEGQDKLEYSITMTFDKNDPCLKEMKKCAVEALIEKFGADKSKWPKNMRDPFRDGDETDYDGFAGKTYVKAANKNAPGLVDQNLKRIIDESQFYSGCIARAELIAFAYDQKGNRGVSFSLQNLQKCGDGKRLGGGKAPEQVFDKVPVENAPDADDDSLFGDETEGDDELW